jgi:uncharacterized membrane protein
VAVTNDDARAKRLRRSVWGATIGILVLALVMGEFPRRYVIGAEWVRDGFTGALYVMFVVSVITNVFRLPWRVRDITLGIVVGLVCIFNALALYQLIQFMIYPQLNQDQIEGVRLLSSALQIWLTNVLAFGLLYWVIDGNGPENRMANKDELRDFVFPGEERQEPGFVDYLFLSFNTATAFSPTDTAPLTSRVRVMMMLESAVSLTALAFAAARAVNILR